MEPFDPAGFTFAVEDVAAAREDVAAALRPGGAARADAEDGGGAEGSAADAICARASKNDPHSWHCTDCRRSFEESTAALKRTLHEQ